MSSETYAPQVLKAGQDNGISPRGIVIAFATVFVESNWVMYANRADPESLTYPHEALSYDANSVGLFQQRAQWWGTSADRMDPYRSAVLFYTQLKRYDYNDLSRTAGYWAQQVQKSAFPDRYDQRMPDAQALYDRLTSGGPAVEKRLDYSRATVAQETGWWCGPAMVQNMLSVRGLAVAEAELARQIEELENPGRGDDRDGTDHISLAVAVLNTYLPEAKYKVVEMPNDPPTKAQVEALWTAIVNAVDAGYAVGANIVSPPSNRPKATNGSAPFAYPAWGTIWHYVMFAGYATLTDGTRAVWWGDSGFAPFGGWVTLESTASLIPPKGYCYPSGAKAAPKPEPVVKPPVVVTPPAPAAPELVWDSRTELEWLAFLGNQAALTEVLKLAAAGDVRARLVVIRIEAANPAALQQFKGAAA